MSALMPCTSRRPGSASRCCSPGPAMNFVIGLVLIYAIAVIWGLPNLHPPTTAIVGETGCVAAEISKVELGGLHRTGPGRRSPVSGPAM